MIGGDSADSFLGSQGDIWDTQWDMFFALLGSIFALIVLGRVHDRSMKTVGFDRG
ncbi:MAG: DUF2238 domain-containing protein [Acidobacteria bacterium]|nr:DUF2238 domain-containing protein [Acidobacteriota bacterium]